MTENIHIKFEYPSAKEAKRKILISELNLLQIKKNLLNYKKFRIQELEKKEKINQKLKGLKLNIISLEKILPKVKIPKILKKRNIRETEIIGEVIKTKSISPTNLERQLTEIKAKLQKLQE